MGEGTEIPRPVVLLQPCQTETRNWVLQVDLEQEKAFVVTETDVVTRMKFLDQLAFKQERLGFAANDMRVEVINCIDQRIKFQVPALPARRMKILTDSFAEIARLAYVNHCAKPILHQVDSRFMRNLAKFTFDVI